MAEAINNASVVCCFMVPEYENSRNCKLELQHAQKLGKLIIPCMVSNRKVWKPSPSKWLDLITGSELAIDFSDTSEVNRLTKTRELINRIKKQLSPPTTELINGTTNQSSVPTTESIPSSTKFFEPIRQKYLQENRMKRLVNEAKSVPIEQNYINLAIVETKEQQENEKKLKRQDEENKSEQDQDPKNHNKGILGTFEEIYGAKTSIDVTNIFDKCKDKTKKVLILGRAGIGKSTFCQYVTYRWAKGDLWSQYELVILIRLRKLTDSRYLSGENYSLVDLVKKEYFSFDDLSDEAKQHFKQQCDTGKVLWILDGYDEFVQNIPEKLRDTFNYVLEMQHHILTSRPYAVALSYDVKMEITGFTNENITTYVEHFFDQIQDEIPNASFEGQKLLKFLESNSSIWGIAHIPVNLELICSLWSDTDWSKTKTLTMTTLYDNITEWLCRRYLQKQNINHTQMRKKKIYDQCHKELQFLETLAFNAMESNEIILQTELIEETENETDCNLDDHPQLLNFGILKAYDDKPTGNQIQAEKQYYFIHLSFQEYFAARHLLQILKGSERQRATKFINNHKYNRRFLYVFIFASGLLAQSDYKSNMAAFWATIQGEPLDLVGLKHIKLVIECLDQLLGHTLFPQSAGYLKLISQWLHICINTNAQVVTDNLLQSLARTNSLSNNSIIQNKLTELLNTNDNVLKCKTLHVIRCLTIWTMTLALVSGLLDALRDEDSDVRQCACEALGNIGEKAATNEVIAGLINAFRDVDSEVRRYAYEALGNIGKKAATNEVITGLINALRDEDSQVRWYACIALGNIGEKAATNEVVTGLINALRDEDSDGRRYACEALGNMGEKAATNEVVAGLINALQDKDWHVRRYACGALGKMGEKAATNEMRVVLIDVLGDEDPQVRQFACEALRNMGEKAATNEVIAGLINALRDEDSQVRWYASQALGNIGEKAATNEVIAGLINALRDADSQVRRFACEALGNMGEKAATNEVFAGLINAFQDEDSDVRRYACEALGNMGEKAATNEVFAGLINALRDGDSDLKRSACKALGKMGEKAATNEVFAGLMNALREGDSDLKRSACEVLGNMGEKAAMNEVIAGLINALRDGDSDLKRSACEALGNMREIAATNEVIASLINAIRDEDSLVRWYACEAVGKMGEKAATNKMITGLINALWDEYPYVRQCACEAVGNMGEKAATNEVIACLISAFRDEDSDVRRYACEVLGNIGEKAATNEVVTGLINALRDEDSDVRRYACEALGNMGEKAATNEVIAGLISAIRDEDSNVEEYAYRALGNIGEKSVTNEVIIGIVNAIADKRPDVDDYYVTDAFERAILSYDAMKELDSQMLRQLYACIKSSSDVKLRNLPADQLIKLFLETENVGWLPLITYAALLQEISVTTVENKIIIHHMNEVLELPASRPELLNSIVKAFNDRRSVLDNNSLPLNETITKTSEY
jgi:HEAT repeat protein